MQCIAPYDHRNERNIDTALFENVQTEKRKRHAPGFRSFVNPTTRNIVHRVTEYRVTLGVA